MLFHMETLCRTRKNILWMLDVFCRCVFMFDSFELKKMAMSVNAHKITIKCSCKSRKDIRRFLSYIKLLVWCTNVFMNRMYRLLMAIDTSDLSKLISNVSIHFRSDKHFLYPIHTDCIFLKISYKILYIEFIFLV